MSKNKQSGAKSGERTPSPVTPEISKSSCYHLMTVSGDSVILHEVTALGLEDVIAHLTSNPVLRVFQLSEGDTLTQRPCKKHPHTTPHS